ncbi:sushi, von Willebrand factor type A, EGF and pentraxin domain-containing protein 1-like [Dreissena polymorpha]|uniref:sushi, von Willebrand factor type A, EGF and pentraxin domain-containing protein 1-like n=1 Tax=Dreissena polymorpha TaxID=45954 RepID=UPI0022649E80|nr:sushi, von Willebrand factor type A, EGF and pentraxin domain-containing protein 1-like [Dreissena polymorpha]
MSHVFTDAESCQSSPCINQGTCTNLIADFHFACVHGLSGKTYEKDVHPPVVNKCPSDIRVNATEKTHLVSWTKPIFSDPKGTELLLLSNYETPSYTFPWGDFTIKYSATKLKNGLQNMCVFNISVKPTPCDPLPVPKHGAILCNDWSTDYGQVCLLVCMRTYSPSPPGKLGSWKICGDDGRWSQTPSDCGRNL